MPGCHGCEGVCCTGLGSEPCTCDDYEDDKEQCERDESEPQTPGLPHPEGVR